MCLWRRSDRWGGGGGYYHELTGSRHNFVADPFLDGKPVKLSKNGSDVICSFAFHYSSCRAFCTACSLLICFLVISPDITLCG